ncbi:acetyl-CoA carboxylase biotin carboxyl carrier protein [bacterium]|nr:acetyl-CoA carboxylase biotin carboxyl carrier protein [bacterium]
MKIAEIRRLVKLVETSEITEIEIEEEGSRIKIVKQQAMSYQQPVQTVFPAGFSGQASPAVNIGDQNTALLNACKSAEIASDNLTKVISPMVGTFYRAPSPEAPSYVNIGDHVNIGQVLCIIEAMKLMNEIEAEVSGKIVKIPVENASPVEFGQTIFEIEPD